MKQSILTGTALLLAAALAGCGNMPAADQAAKISMEQAQTAALDAANIDAADADISSATLGGVAGVTCCKVPRFTSGNHTYAYSINAESGEVLGQLPEPERRAHGQRSDGYHCIRRDHHSGADYPQHQHLYRRGGRGQGAGDRSGTRRGQGGGRHHHQVQAGL